MGETVPLTDKAIGQIDTQSEQLSKRKTRGQERRAAIRCFISGYVDAYSLLTFGVYASFMTGNTTSGGVHTGQMKLAQAGHSLLPIPFFMSGIFLGTLLVQTNPRRALTRLSIAVAILLGASVIATQAGKPSWLSIMFLSISMGLTNSSVTKVGSQSVSLGFMTGDLNNLARHLTNAFRRRPAEQAQGSWDTPLDRITILATLWTSFFCGAIVGTVLSLYLGANMLLIPATVMLVLAFFERTIVVS